MKRQQQSALLSSSSSHRERNGHVENSQDLQVKGVGCMSSFFHIVFKYQNKRKSLTYGKKHEKIIVVPVTVAEPPRATAAVPKKAGSIIDAKSTNRDKRCVMDHETPRSPTIQPEIHLHSGSLSSPRAVTSPLTLVAQLMGLSHEEADGEEPKGAAETTAEKRRKLLGALEKCDEDVQALKRIIDVVMQSEVRDRKLVCEENPSPLSVLNWPRVSLEKHNRSSIDSAKAKAAHQLRKKRGGIDQEDTSATNSTPCHSIRLLERITSGPFSLTSRLSNRDKLAVAAAGTSTSSRPSKAMTESVEQVCQDVTLGERREAGRIGVALHDHICRELIEETIREMGSPGQSDRGQPPS